jgi:hypothetical protein
MILERESGGEGTGEYGSGGGTWIHALSAIVVPYTTVLRAVLGEKHYTAWVVDV